jgi:hypothetical protein
MGLRNRPRYQLLKQLATLALYLVSDKSRYQIQLVEKTSPTSVLDETSVSTDETLTVQVEHGELENTVPAQEPLEEHEESPEKPTPGSFWERAIEDSQGIVEEWE